MAIKRMQLVMIWFLPIIVIGGLFFPGLGYFLDEGDGLGDVL